MWCNITRTRGGCAVTTSLEIPKCFNAYSFEFFFLQGNHPGAASIKPHLEKKRRYLSRISKDGN